MATRHSQPQSGPFIPSAYWLSRGLQMVFDGRRVLWSRASSAPSAVTKGGTPKVKTVQTGLVSGFGTTYGTGTTDRIDSGRLASPTTGRRSVFVRVFAKSTGGAAIGRVFQSTVGTGIATVGEEGIWFVSGGMAFSRVGSNLVVPQYRTTSAFPLNRWATFGYSFLGDYPTNTTPLMCVDGVPVAVSLATAATAAFSANTAMNVSWGNRADGTRGWDGMLDVGLVFDGYLSPDEHAELNANPWCVGESSSRQRLPSATSEGSTYAPTTGHLSLSGKTPGVTQTAGVTVSPATGHLTLAGNTPGVDVGGSVTTSPTTGHLTLAGNTPTVTASGHVVTSPTTGHLTLAGGTPTVSAISIFNLADRGTVDLSLSSVTPNGSTPTITIRNRHAGDINTSGARFTYFSVTGVSGMTPVFDVERANMENANASAKFKWSYTGAMGSWVDFDTTTKVSTPNVYRSSNAAAFSQDTVYVAMNFPWPISYTDGWLANLSESLYVSEPPSSLGSGFVFGTRSATTNGSTAGVGDVIPSQPMHSLMISSGGLAPDGTAKRKMVLFSGMHAAEDVGNYVLQGAVEFLISADTQAVLVRDWFDVFVYPMVATAGRAGGGQRIDFENLYKLRDINREWAGTVMESVEKHKTAITTDAGGSVHVFFDFHGTHLDAPFNYYVGTAISTWTTAIRTYIPSIVVNDLNGQAGTSGRWIADNKGTEYAVTPEYPYHTTITLANTLAYGANHMRAVAKLIANGEWGIVPTTGHLSLAGNIPGVVQTGTTVVAPMTGRLVASGQTPTVSQTANQAVSPTTGHLALVGQNPIIAQPQSIAPSTGRLAVGGRTPEVVTGYVINPTTGALIFTGNTPTVDQPRTISPTTGHTILRGLVPTVSITGTAVYPLPSQVLAGVTYGPNGNDYTGTATGGASPTAAEIAAEVLAVLGATNLPVNVVRMNGALVTGDGTAGNLWRGA